MKKQIKQTLRPLTPKEQDKIRGELKEGYITEEDE